MVEVLPLADDFGFNDPAPFACPIAISIEGEKVVTLHFADPLLAVEGEWKSSAPMAPIVPGAECVVDLGVVENRGVRCARPYDDAVKLFDLGDQFFVGAGSEFREYEKPPVSLAAIWSTAMLRVGSRIRNVRSMMSSLNGRHPIHHTEERSAPCNIFGSACARDSR